MRSLLCFSASLAVAQALCDGEACPILTQSPSLLQRKSTAEKSLISDDDYNTAVGAPVCKLSPPGRACVEGLKIAVGGKCTPECKSHGTQPSSSAVLTCGADGKFDGGFDCVGETCSAAALAHTIPFSLGCDEGLSLANKEKCTVKCKPGYSANGKTVECLGGTFAAHSITCKGTPCAAPPTILNAYTRPCTEGHFPIASETTCTATCNTDYAPDVAELSCAGGVLTPATFSCAPGHCMAPTIANAHADGSCKEGLAIAPSNGICTGQCAPGYVVWPPYNLECTAGRFNGTFTCEKPDPIPAPGIKRGVGAGSRDVQLNHVSMYDFGKSIGWWYDWSPNVASKSPYWNSKLGKELLAKTNYVPMMNREYDLNAGNWTNMYGDSPYILGLNEPYGTVDLKGRPKYFAPSLAVSVWSQWEAKKAELEAKTGTKIQLGSHSISPKPGAFTWANETFALFKPNLAAKVDFMAVHWYACSAERLISGLDMLYEHFKLPIWLTELNCGSYSMPGGRPATLEEQTNYMKIALPLLDAHPHVVRYAWYADDTGNNGINASLFAGPYGMTPSPLFEIYNGKPGVQPKACAAPKLAAGATCEPGCATPPCAAPTAGEIASGTFCTPQCASAKDKPDSTGLYCTLGSLEPETFTCETRGADATTIAPVTKGRKHR